MLFTIVVVLALLLGSPTVDAYEEVPIQDGGAVTGKVTMHGKPSPKAFNLVTFPDPVYCGRISTGTGWRILEDFVMARDGSLKDVVVMLSEVPGGKPFQFTPPTIEARDCQFLPFVSIVRGEQNIRVVNMDPVMHDVQAYETSHLGPRVLFNSPLPMNPNHRREVGPHSHRHLPGDAIDEHIHLTKGRKFFVMQCGFHAYMESWALAVEHPYYAITNADGTFAIGDVPPGEYTLIAWHPAGGLLEQQITVLPNGTTEASFQFKAATGRHSPHQIVEHPHYGVEALGKPLEILPTLIQQTP